MRLKVGKDFTRGAFPVRLVVRLGFKRVRRRDWEPPLVGTSQFLIQVRMSVWRLSNDRLCGLIAFYALAVFGTVWPDIELRDFPIMICHDHHSLMLLVQFTLRFAPRAAKQGRATFLQSIRFLIARFRVDYWWYGVLSKSTVCR